MNVIMHTFISYWLFEILTNMTRGFCGFFFYFCEVFLQIEDKFKS